MIWHCCEEFILNSASCASAGRPAARYKTSVGEYVPVEEVEKVYQDGCPWADFVFLPKETKVAYVAICVVVSESIGPVRRATRGGLGCQK